MPGAINTHFSPPPNWGNPKSKKPYKSPGYVTAVNETTKCLQIVKLLDRSWANNYPSATLASNISKGVLRFRPEQHFSVSPAVPFCIVPPIGNPLKYNGIENTIKSIVWIFAPCRRNRVANPTWCEDSSNAFNYVFKVHLTKKMLECLNSGVSWLCEDIICKGRTVSFFSL